MNELKSKIRRLKFKLVHDFFSIENIVLIVAILLCLAWTTQSINAMTRNWELSERLRNEKKTLELLKIEIEAAEIENAYYGSNEYQEIVARKQLDKKFEGENMVVLPDNSKEAIEKYKDVTYKYKEPEYSNFEKWMMYLFPKY